tara:strand:+ start:1945 stop:2343 length:399 start_codon:yes stop_codon:yes gene_type:complete
MATLTAAITLTSQAGGPFSDALATSLSTTYTVDLANEIKKIQLTGTAIQIQEADLTGATLLIVKNIGTTAGTHFVKVHNSSTDTIASNRISTLDVGEVAIIPGSGAQDVYVNGTSGEFVEVMIFTVAASDRS